MQEPQVLAGVREGRRPSPLFWLIAAALPVLALLLTLGAWQLRRLDWKSGLLAEIAAAEAGPAQALGATSPPPYAKLVATGRFDHAREALVGLEVRGATLGAHLLTPLLRDARAPVLVDRGWVPLERAAPIERPEGAVTVTGWSRAGERRDAMAATDDVAGRHFYTYDPAAIAAAIGVPDALPIALVALGPAAARPPIPAQSIPRPGNRHLGYAVTWFGLAAALLGVLAALAWRRLKDRR